MKTFFGWRWTTCFSFAVMLGVTMFGLVIFSIKPSADTMVETVRSSTGMVMMAGLLAGACGATLLNSDPERRGVSYGVGAGIPLLALVTAQGIEAVIVWMGDASGGALVMKFVGGMLLGLLVFIGASPFLIPAALIATWLARSVADRP